MEIKNIQDNKLEIDRVKGLKSFQDLICPFIAKKTSAVAKINSYLRKYKVEEMAELMELFEIEFKEMKNANLAMLNKNIIELSKEKPDLLEIDDADERLSYVLLSKDGVPIKCEIDFKDTPPTVFIKGTLNRILSESSKYIALAFAPDRLDIVVNHDNSHNLCIRCDDDSIAITENDKNKVTTEEYNIYGVDENRTIKFNKHTEEESTQEIN